MAFLLVGALYSAALSLMFGWGAEGLILHFLPADRPASANRPWLTILLGMAVISGLLGVWSFFWGISTRALVAFTGVGLAVAFAVRRHAWASILAARDHLKSGGAIPVAVFAVAWIYALYMAAAAAPTYDVGLYHAQAIRWIEFFPVVPGLANLHERLGFNSSLFLLSALWGFVALQWHAYQIPSLVIALCMFGYSMSAVSERPVQATLPLFLAAGMLLYFASQPRLWTWLASPSTDLCAAMIAWTIFLLAANLLQDGGRPRTTSDLWSSLCVIVVLSVFDVTIKASAAPILLLALFFLLKAHALYTWKRALALVGLAGVVALPWAARNVALTGYVLYPFQGLDLFSVDWKLPAGNVRALELMIRAWAIHPGLPWSESSLSNIANWFPSWWHSLSGMDPYLVCLSFGMPALLAVFTFFRRDMVGDIRRHIPLYAVAYAGLLFWFLNAPDTRLGYSFLVPAFLFAALPFIRAFATAIRIRPQWLGYTAQALSAFVLLLQVSQVPLKSWKHYVRAWHEYPEIGTTVVHVNDLAVLVPATGDQCWYAPLPCTPAVAPGLALRGASLFDGFQLRGK